MLLQGCWKGEAVVRTFLGGPLHAELAAVQDLLRQTAPSAAALNTSASHGSHAALMGELSRDENDRGDEGHVLATNSSARDDVTCPICMVRFQLVVQVVHQSKTFAQSCSWILRQLTRRASHAYCFTFNA